MIEVVAIESFASVAKVIGTAIENRDRTIASSPAVLAAIGVLGHPLVSIVGPVEREAEKKALLDWLRTVNWEKRKHWEGIAGKFTPKGEFSVGGPKGTAYAICTSLKDASFSGYSRNQAADCNSCVREHETNDYRKLGSPETGSRIVFPR